MNEITIKGHHGTNFDSSKKIVNSNYKISKGDDHWLGDGVYFFVEGISTNTVKLAEKWAIAQSWDKTRNRRTYSNFAVLESEIKVSKEKFLDLTTEEGVEILYYFVEKYLTRLKYLGKGLDFYDGLLINMARKEDILPIDVVKGNFYIKFEKERKYRVNLRTSNCTICVVYDPNKNIKSTNQIKQGKIK